MIPLICQANVVKYASIGEKQGKKPGINAILSYESWYTAETPDCRSIEATISGDVGLDMSNTLKY